MAAKLMCGKVSVAKGVVTLEADASVHQTILAVHAALKSIDKPIPQVLQDYITETCYKNIY